MENDALKQGQGFGGQQNESDDIGKLNQDLEEYIKENIILQQQVEELKLELDSVKTANYDEFGQ